MSHVETLSDSAAAAGSIKTSSEWNRSNRLFFTPPKVKFAKISASDSPHNDPHARFVQTRLMVSSLRGKKRNHLTEWKSSQQHRFVDVNM